MTTTEQPTGTVEAPDADAAAETVEEPQEPTEAPEDAPQDDAEADEDTPTRKLRAEAKKYRTQLRETEAQRDTLTTQVEQLQRTHAEAALADVLGKPSSLWMTGANPADFFDESGALDVDGLRTAATEARQQHGLQGFKRFGGSADGGVRQSVKATPGFADAFKPRR